MFYLDVSKTLDPARTAQRLLDLKSALSLSGVPPKRDGAMLLATWNIREFDSPAYGERSLECLHYIAEICSHFDLIAIQEVRENLQALDKVRNLLGAHWKYVVSDVTEGKPGNRERMAFLYDSRKVTFNGIAGEIVMPPKSIKKNRKTIRYDPAGQLARTPYLVGFRSGWFAFMLCTVHMLYGADQANNPKRVEEIRMVAEFLAKRARERTREYSNLVLLGDFNIYDPGDETMRALTDAKFSIPEELQTVPRTNIGLKKRHFDQIAIMRQRRRLETTGRAGVFDFYETVYRDKDRALYIAEMGPSYNTTSKGKARNKAGKRSYYRTYWRTHQMSDHLPMWIEFRTDFSGEHLTELVGDGV